jgi:hypothetical protein
MIDKDTRISITQPLSSCISGTENPNYNTKVKKPMKKVKTSRSY